MCEKEINNLILTLRGILYIELAGLGSLGFFIANNQEIADPKVITRDCILFLILFGVLAVTVYVSLKFNRMLRNTK